MTFSKPSRGLSAGGGSFSNTSSPAPAITPSLSALTRSPSRITSPLEVLMMKAPAFIALNFFQSTRPLTMKIGREAEVKRTQEATA